MKRDERRDGSRQGFQSHDEGFNSPAARQATPHGTPHEDQIINMTNDDGSVSQVKWSEIDVGKLLLMLQKSPRGTECFPDIDEELNRRGLLE